MDTRTTYDEMGNPQRLQVGGDAFPGMDATGLRPDLSALDYFAGQALCGLLAGRNYGTDVANASYGIAADMLAERDKRNEIL